jgi:hypothetical protein
MNETFLKRYSSKRTPSVAGQYPSLYTVLASMNRADSLEAMPIYANPEEQELFIEFAEPHLRMREVVRRSNYRATGKFPSRKNGRMMHWESQHELAAFLILEVSPHVRCYQEQPAEIQFMSRGNWHTHYPDILVELVGGNKGFIEVKPQSAVRDEGLDYRTRLLKTLLASHGYRYVMVLPEQLQRDAYLENAKSLLVHWRPFMSIAPWEKVRSVMVSKRQMPLAQLVELLGSPEAKTWVSQFLLNGTLQCDFSKPLENDSIISWAGNGGGI